MYIPDPLEIMEASAERWAEENIKGNMFKCSCGRICKLSKAETLSSNPYAIPVCRDCCEKYYEREIK